MVESYEMIGLNDFLVEITGSGVDGATRTSQFARAIGAQERETPSEEVLSLIGQGLKRPAEWVLVLTSGDSPLLKIW